MTSQSGFYKAIDECTKGEVQQYYFTLRKHVRTLYFDRMLPLVSHLEQAQKDELYGHLDLFIDLEENER